MSMMGNADELTNNIDTIGTLFVITAYTYEECEDDEEVISGLVEDKTAANCHQVWAPETNFFASRMQRITETADNGRKYYENGAWQAWLFK